MPELPEVEITRRGVEPFVVGTPIEAVIVRQNTLRYPVPGDLAAWLSGQTVLRVWRRGKYLLFEVAGGHMLVHLGMSGTLRIVPRDQPAAAHDHLDWVFASHVLRYRDPRRFGAVLRVDGPVLRHPLLASLGVEPLSEDFDAAALQALCQGRNTAIKQLLMDSHCVVGVGNIYASESLFRAGIHPATPAGRLSRPRLARLADAVRATLLDALAAGGSSLRDFVHSDGSSGYFQQQYAAYGRAGEPCRICGRPIVRTVMGNRATFHCPVCQKR